MTLLAPRRKRLAIGMTSLIDVVFILLMFFMLTSSFVRVRAFDLLAPVASSEQNAREPQLIKLDRSGQLQRFDGSLISAHYLNLDQQALASFDSQQPLVLVVNGDVEVQAIVSSLELLKAAGFKVSLGDILSAEVTP